MNTKILDWIFILIVLLHRSHHVRFKTYHKKHVHVAWFLAGLRLLYAMRYAFPLSPPLAVTHINILAPIRILVATNGWNAHRHRNQPVLVLGQARWRIRGQTRDVSSHRCGPFRAYGGSAVVVRRCRILCIPRTFYIYHTYTVISQEES